MIYLGVLQHVHFILKREDAKTAVVFKLLAVATSRCFLCISFVLLRCLTGALDAFEYSIPLSVSNMVLATFVYLTDLAPGIPPPPIAAHLNFAEF
jgi:hypothetical protein